MYLKSKSPCHGVGAACSLRFTRVEHMRQRLAYVAQSQCSVLLDTGAMGTKPVSIPVKGPSSSEGGWI